METHLLWVQLNQVLFDNTPSISWSLGGADAALYADDGCYRSQEHGYPDECGDVAVVNGAMVDGPAPGCQWSDGLCRERQGE